MHALTTTSRVGVVAVTVCGSTQATPLLIVGLGISPESEGLQAALTLLAGHAAPSRPTLDPSRVTLWNTRP